METEPLETGSTLPTSEHVENRRQPKQNVNERHRASFTRIDRLAIWITNHVGTMGQAIRLKWIFPR